MLRQRLRYAQEHFDQIKSILIGSATARDQMLSVDLANAATLGVVDVAYSKAYDHCAAVVRCYATFENFVLNAVDEWVRWSLAHRPGPFLKLESVRARYESGFAEILRRRTATRFAGLNRARLAEGLTLLYADPVPVNPSLSLEPFFAKQGNLTLAVVTTLFSAIGLGDPNQWIAECTALQALCVDEGFGVEEELKQLVERRNEAAHGSSLPTEILGTNDLVALVELLSRLCACLGDFVLVSICRAELGDSLERGVLGTVTRVWKEPSVFELTVADTTIYVDLPVVFVGRSVVELSIIKSIQVEGVQTLGFTDGAGTALGIKTTCLPLDGMQMLDPSKVRGLCGLMA